MLVCPNCGHDEFEATLTTRTEYTYQVERAGHFHEVSETVVDGGDVGDIDTLACTDCGDNFDPDDLITEAEYSTEEAFGDLL